MSEGHCGYHITSASFIATESIDEEWDSCCVVWTLTRDMETVVTIQQLRSLHNEVASCCEIVGGTPLEVSPTRGAFQCFDASDGQLSAADAALYAGMLLCRWASSQEDVIDVRCGIHVGALRKIVLPPSDIPRFFGTALHMSRELSEKAPTGTSVHFLAETRNALSVFENLPVCVCRKAYYIDTSMPGAFDKLERLLEEGRRGAYSTAFAMRNDAERCRKDLNSMNLEEFKAFLESHGVDTGEFGKGWSKSIKQFFDELVTERKSWLRETDTGLKRYLSIARIKVRANDPSGLCHHLNMGLEIDEKGIARNRDQCLGASVKEDCRWEDEVVNCFKNRLLVPKELQDRLLTTEAYWFKEEEIVSPSIPGLTTVYMTHEVVIRVNMPPPKGVTVLGLPDLSSFVTDSKLGKRFHWSWIPEGSPSTKSKQDDFCDFLLRYNVKVEEFEPGVLTDLISEVDSKVSTLEVHGDEVLRRLSILKVCLICDILSVPHVLITRSKKRRGKNEDLRTESAITMRLMQDQNWEDAVYDLLRDRLCLNETANLKNDVGIDRSSHRLVEETAYSSSYPGIKTVYLINEVTCRLRCHFQCLGLPHGDSFVVRRPIKTAYGENDVVTTSFSWTPASNCLNHIPVKTEAPGVDPKRRVEARSVARPLPPECRGLDAIVWLISGRRTDWHRARSAARRILDPDYNVRMFFEDCVGAFPELNLYLPCSEDISTTSGRTLDDEYQRTVGALFAFFWLMRLHLDGAQSFVYGVGGDSWSALSESSTSPKRSHEELMKRKQFLATMKWQVFQDMFVRAGLLSKNGDGEQGHDEEQTLAMLVLTVIHDVMKASVLLPVVSEKHTGPGGFRGFAVGDKITDHDLALSYVMEYAPEVLPSYNALSDQKKSLLLFTQSAMEFNMGWLVQAEAPPGALFRKFKRITVDGKADAGNIAFYFVHWLTDLAGAEPFPLEGCEKFVLLFPQAVMTMFLKSFPHVAELSQKSETATLEGYVVWRWANATPRLGPTPSGVGSIARLRLAAMAPMHAKSILDAYEDLPAKTSMFLDDELAVTGIAGQAYERDEHSEFTGPAFLVYYAPAFLSKNGAPTQATQALVGLAEVLLQARFWWPRTKDDADKVVTLRIDQIKGKSMSEVGQLQQGEFWALQKTNAIGAQVIRARMFDSDSGTAEEHDWSKLRVLNFEQR